MQKLVLVCIVLSLSTGTRLDFNSDDCSVFLNKFFNPQLFDIASAYDNKIAFSGNASFIVSTTDVEVKLGYTDIKYFNDPKYYGLVIQDGKTPETTCLDMKLIRYANSDFSEGVEVTDLTITPSENITEKQRFYSFTIKGSELAKRLTETKNFENLIYYGYYAIEYYAAEKDKNFFRAFYFGFNVTINRTTGAAVDTAFQRMFKPNSLDVNSSIKWCTDFTCTKFAQPELHLNDQFVLLQTITKQELTNYYLTGSEVWYTGNGLNKKANIIQYDNTTPGQIKLLLNAEVVWKSFKIQVTGVLSTNPSGTRRLLELTTYDTVTGYTDEIPCIKPEGSDVCGTCEQECDANGLASDGCEICSSSAQKILYVLLLIFLVVTF